MTDSGAASERVDHGLLVAHRIDWVVFEGGVV
jgi:hypothetical protein